MTFHAPGVSLRGLKTVAQSHAEDTTVSSLSAVNLTDDTFSIEMASLCSDSRQCGGTLAKVNEMGSKNETSFFGREKGTKCALAKNGNGPLAHRHKGMMH